MLAGGLKEFQLPFSPYGLDVLTPFANDPVVDQGGEALSEGVET